jgi:NADH dehydrogenase (ubiquinone) Fe-S protein 3
MLALILIKSKNLKKKYLVFLKIILNKYIKKVHVKSNLLYIKTLAGYIYPIALFLKNHTASQFKTLVDIIAYDKPGNKFRFTLIYILLSIDLNYRIKIELKLTEKNPIVSSLIPIYSSVGWLEREV